MTKVRPLGDKILVKRAAAEDRTDAGIFLPQTAKDKPREGTVMALGNGLLNRDTGEYMPFSVKKGDHVISSSSGGTDIHTDGEELIMMTEDDVLGIVD